MAIENVISSPTVTFFASRRDQQSGPIGIDALKGAEAIFLTGILGPDGKEIKTRLKRVFRMSEQPRQSH